MKISVTIDSSNAKAKELLSYLKSLDFVNLEIDDSDKNRTFKTTKIPQVKEIKEKYTNRSELQNEKQKLINWITNLEDFDTISRVRSIRNETVEIPQWQQDLIDTRLQKIKNGEEKFYDFDEAIKEIENEL